MPRKSDSYISLVEKGLPDQMDVYVDEELTEISVGFMLEDSQKEEFVHNVFPSLGVAKQSGKYRKYKPGSTHRNKMKKRTDGAESEGSGFETETDDFSTEVWAWHTDIGPQTRANASGSAEVDQVATEECSTSALINREVEWVTNYFGVDIWDTELQFDATPTGDERLSWMDEDSDPIADLRLALTMQRKRAVGKRAQHAVFSEDVWERLLVHPALRALWGSGQTPGGPTMGNPSVFKTQLASLLEIETIRVAKALYTTSEDGDPTETFDTIVPTGVGLFYAPATPSIMRPSAGYTFNWTGYIGAGEQGQVITRETIPLTKGSQRYEIEQAYGFKLVSAACGAFLRDVLAE